MMSQLVEGIRRIARREVERVLKLQTQPRMGNIVAWDPKTHRAKVELQPEGVVTGWIPSASPWIGNGWGIVPSHTVGAQVMVMFPEFGGNQGIIMGRVFDERNPPPQGVKDGDLMIAHQSGSFITLTTHDKGLSVHSEGKIAITSKDTMIFDAPKAEFRCPNGVAVLKNGVLTAQGEITALNGTSGSVTVGTHTHEKVLTGNDHTGKPDGGT